MYDKAKQELEISKTGSREDALKFYINSDFSNIVFVFSRNARALKMIK